MTQDHAELPEEIGQALGRLGRVAPPDPRVLDAAREILWAAVAAEMLPDEAAGAVGQVGEAGRPSGSRRVAKRETDQPGQAGSGPGTRARDRKRGPTAGRPAVAAEFPAAVDRRDDQRGRQRDGGGRGAAARGDGAPREHLRRRGADRRGVSALAGHRPAGRCLGGPAAAPGADDRLRRDLRAAVREPARRRLGRAAEHRAGGGRGPAGRPGQRRLCHGLPGLSAVPGQSGRTRRGQRQAARRRVGGRDQRPRRGRPGGPGARRGHRAAVQRGQFRCLGRLPAAHPSRGTPSGPGRAR